jgi:hypothetical protein
MTKTHNKTEIGRAINRLRNTSADWGIYRGKGSGIGTAQAHDAVKEAEAELRRLVDPLYTEPPAARSHKSSS